jgi:hypothetical protein
VKPLYFYGVLGSSDAGHHPYVSDGESVRFTGREAGPFRNVEIDGVWCQREPWPAGEASSRGSRDPQAEGVAYVHHVRGWTIASWWDRSADKRRGSCAVFLAEGAHDLAAMLAAARDLYPSTMARIEARYTIRDGGAA